MYGAAGYIQSPGINQKGNKKERMYTYNWVTLLDGRNYHNIVNQLHLDNNNQKKLELIFGFSGQRPK